MENKIKFNNGVYLGFKKELDERYEKELKEFRKELDKKYERELEEFKEKLNKESEKEFEEFKKKLEQLENNFLSAEYKANKFQYDLNNLYKSILKCENNQNIKEIIGEVIITISSYVKNDQDVMREIACKTLAKIAININKPDITDHIIEKIGDHTNLHLTLFEILFNSTKEDLQNTALDVLISKNSAHCRNTDHDVVVDESADINYSCISNNMVIKNNVDNITKIINNIYNLNIKQEANCKNLYREFFINIINNSKDKELINLLVQKIYEFDSDNKIISDVFRYYDNKIHNLKDDIASRMKALICDNTKAYFSNIFKSDINLFKTSICHLKTAHTYIKYINEKITLYKNYKSKLKNVIKAVDDQQCKRENNKCEKENSKYKKGNNNNIFNKIISNIKIKNKFLKKLFDKRINLNGLNEIESENELDSIKERKKIDFIKKIIEISNDNKKIGSTVKELIKITKDDETYFNDFDDIFDFIKNDKKKTKLVLEKIRYNNIKLYNSIIDSDYITDNNKYVKQITNNFAKKEISFFRK